MGTDLLLAAALALVAVLLAGEMLGWWRPLPARGSLQRRLAPSPARSRKGPLPPSLRAALLTLPPLHRWQQRRLKERARAELPAALSQLQTTLRSGQSLATALRLWPDGLAQTLGDGRSLLLPAIRRVRDELDRGATPEEALTALAERLGLEEMRTLAHVVRLSRQRGSDLGPVVSETVRMLHETLEVRLKLQTLTAGKRAEGLVITFLPPAMLLVLTLVNPTYAAPLVHTNAGRLMLGVALALMTTSFFVSRWLMQSEV
jgi:tight adherence protein B